MNSSFENIRVCMASVAHFLFLHNFIVCKSFVCQTLATTVRVKSSPPNRPGKLQSHYENGIRLPRNNTFQLTICHQCLKYHLPEQNRQRKMQRKNTRDLKRESQEHIKIRRRNEGRRKEIRNTIKKSEKRETAQ